MKYLGGRFSVGSTKELRDKWDAVFGARPEDKAKRARRDALGRAVRGALQAPRCACKRTETGSSVCRACMEAVYAK